jgi:hypothetical protein
MAMAVRKPSAPSKALSKQRSLVAEPSLPDVIVLTPEEAWEQYEAAARDLLGVSTTEFERRWAAGDYERSDDHGDAVGVWLIRTSRPGN